MSQRNRREIKFTDIENKIRKIVQATVHENEEKIKSLSSVSSVNRVNGLYFKLTIFEVLML